MPLELPRDNRGYLRLTDFGFEGERGRHAPTRDGETRDPRGQAGRTERQDFNCRYLQSRHPEYNHRRVCRGYGGAGGPHRRVVDPWRRYVRARDECEGRCPDDD